MFRVGIGHDTHRLGPDRPLILGGLRIEHPRGLIGHSDADVVLHALTDALLGAAGLGDIGEHFANDDPQWRGADSARFVRRVLALLQERGLTVGNVDITVLAEKPKLAPHRSAIRNKVAALLEIPAEQVNVKATTTEGLGFLGRGEGIGAQAIALLLESGAAAAAQRDSST